MLRIHVLVVFVICVAPAWTASIPAPPTPTRADLVQQQKLKEFLQTVPADIAQEALMTVPQMIEEQGYPAEAHTVTTDDGYVLEMHRIPYGRDGPSENRPVAFLQHGIISSSADWVITGPTKALAYILADEGYDVWLGNSRGNRYSRKHVSLDPDKDAKQFWNFDWHEIGVSDLPAMIDYVLDATDAASLYYAGHSQGTTSFYVMASTKPEYNAKIKVQVSMAPIAYMSHLTSPLMQLISFFNGPVELLADLIGVNEFLPSSDFMASAGDLLCSDGSISQFICTNTLFVLCGFDSDQFNSTILPVLMGHTPAGSSTHQLLHYGQEIRSGHFRQYDHGLLDNLGRYQSFSPPDYDLGKITAPVYLIYSTNDWLSAPQDVDKLYKELGNAQARLLVSDPNFNHLDYMYAIEAPVILYPKVVSLFARHHS